MVLPMPSWREMAQAALEPHQAPPPAAPAPLPTYGLGEALAGNLWRLANMPPPRIRDRAAWGPVVQDALSLARDGWAAKALALGWHELDLFGVDTHDSSRFAGLAVWLDGRTIGAMDDQTAIAKRGTSRAVFYRGGFDRAGTVTPVFLWELGR